MMMRKILLLFGLVFIMSLSAVAQTVEASNFKIPDDKKNYGLSSFIEARYHHGRHLPNNGKLENILENPYNAIDLRIGLQTDGSKLWEQLYGYPAYGIGFYTADLGSSDTLGEPSAVFLFFNAPIKRWKRFSMHWGFEVGIAYDFNNYNAITNPRNDAIGSKVNVHLAAGFLGAVYDKQAI
jgi:hypothetical protein